MTFILRAILVIAALTYFAAQRQGVKPLDEADARLDPRSVDVAAAWNALPAGTRDRLAHQGISDLTRRLTAAEPSQDTLAESDRRPAWRGAQSR